MVVNYMFYDHKNIASYRKNVFCLLVYLTNPFYFEKLMIDSTVN